MKILALVPARGGSKRLPGKNIKLLDGNPLINWTIDIIQGMDNICDVLVSTDDSAIAEVARQSGALVPWLRPAELATDTSSTIDVCLHALDWYESMHGPIDGLLLLQPTSPFRKREVLLSGMKLFQENHARSVIGVSLAHSHPQWCFYLEDDYLRPYVKSESIPTRAQDLPCAYEINGSFYLSAPQSLREQRSFFSSHMVPLVDNEMSASLDIDTEWDWVMAEAIIKHELSQRFESRHRNFRCAIVENKEAAKAMAEF